MGQKECGNCSEMVDEAKAFCPGCGNAFVEEEKREHASEFEQLDNTVQLGQTMYNQMLSDMGLNISKTAPPPEKKPEPVETRVSQKRIEVIAPAAGPARPAVKPPPQPAKPASKTNWFIIAGVALILMLALAIGAAALFVVYWTRFK